VSNSDPSSRSTARPISPLRRWFRRLIVCVSFAYLAFLIALALAFYLVGERWWVTAAGLYLPRLPLLAPLPVVALLLWMNGLSRLLWTQALALIVGLFPLMGLVLPWPTAVHEGQPRLRMLSFNVNSSFYGYQTILHKIADASPDIVLLQEAPGGGGQLLDALRARYPHVETSTQFMIASRFAILATEDPERLPYYGRERSPRFMRYLIETPLGKIAFYSVHPISPRGVLHVYRLRGLVHLLRTGAILSGNPESDVESNATLRAIQIEAVARKAARELDPVIIAGDTNLPGLSSALRNLSEYGDGFRRASSGFGYTFPAKYPFLRLDRIWAGPELRFVNFQVGCAGASDHLCVIADLQRR
jgi:endonuclease/exonuclease/phosphatase (EEP) superfamily protein YafD